MTALDESKTAIDDLAHLARLALVGKERDVHTFVRRLANRYQLQAPQLSKDLAQLLRQAGSKTSVLRGTTVEAIPVDLDSRLQLARPEYPVQLDIEPQWRPEIQNQLRQIVAERLKEEELQNENLSPTRTALLTGPPGVGKTLAARWIAAQLDLPLIVLDLSAVMSSFLGRTGNNVRNLLDYAKGIRCVLLLDEFDAIAKRRNDDAEVGELKRLVTVLLQEIDNWPSSSLLVAATNHEDLLDPAVWRRFEAIIRFDMPTAEDVNRTLRLHLGDQPGATRWQTILTRVLQGMSYADIERAIRCARREAVVQVLPLEETLGRLVKERVEALPKVDRRGMALSLMEAGLSQREASEWTGVSRDTIRKYQ